MICEWCGKALEEGRWKCRSCAMEGEPKAYLTITNMVSDIFRGDLLDGVSLSSYILSAMQSRYRCPVCFAELPNERRGTAAGDMENVPGSCPRCEKVIA
jgi:rubrerythrin